MNSAFSILNWKGQIRKVEASRFKRSWWTGPIAVSLTASPVIVGPTALAQAPIAHEDAEIVVRAVRGKCRVQFADRMVSDRELAALSGEWAALGRPVRVVAPDGAGYKCLAKIAFRLNDHGVRLIHFVDRDEATSATPAATPGSVQ